MAASAQVGIFDGAPLRVDSVETVEAFPRWLSTEALHPFVRAARNVLVYDSLWSYCTRHTPPVICLLRRYALGDILMLLTVIQAMRGPLDVNYAMFDAAPPQIIVAIEDRFFNQLQGLNRSLLCRLVPSRGIQDYGADVHFNLDHCLEPDHLGGDASNVDRCELYAQAMGVSLIHV